MKFDDAIKKIDQGISRWKIARQADRSAGQRNHLHPEYLDELAEMPEEPMEEDDG